MGVTFAGINLSVKDPVQSFAFYQGLGLTVKSEAAPDDEWYGAEFALTADSDRPLLWIWRDHGGHAVRNEIVLDCDNIDETYQELKAKGYAVTEPEMQFWGGKEMRLTDPDGNEILFL